MLGMDNLRRSVHTQVIKNGGLTIFTDKEKVGNFQAYSRTKWGNSDILIPMSSFSSQAYILDENRT